MTDESARTLAWIAGVFIFGASALAYFLFSRPADFPAPDAVRVERGASIDAVAEQFSRERLIRFPFVFRLLSRLAAGRGSLKAGDYYFERPLTLVSVWWRLERGIYDIHPVKLTIPEGWTARQIGEEFEKRKFFTAEEWSPNAEKFEGYLFPDTYFFAPNAKPDFVVRAMVDNFNVHIDAALQAEIARQKKSLTDVVIMASLIEKESSGDPNDAAVISGILWKRMAAGIGLQVDAALTYVTGRASLELRQSALASDSLYNTYTHKGLPPTPIANPGLIALRAAIYPQQSPYLFYLHDKQGRTHFSSTFDEHIMNKERYLR